MTSPAAKLLDAQVSYLLARLSGERLVELLATDVTDLLSIAESLVLRDVVDVAVVQAAGHELVDAVLGSSMVADLVPLIADALYDLEASEEYDLGDVVDREAVSTLVA